MAIVESKGSSGTIKAHDAQLKFLNIDARFAGFIGGVGSGKTIAGAMKVLSKALNKEGQKGIVATRTYPLLRDVVIASVQEVVPDPLIDDFNKNESIMSFKNGSKVFFRPLETERQIDRIRGYSANWAWVDEAAYIPWYAIKVLNARLREGEDQQLAVTTTPKGFNWVYEKFEEPPRKIPRLEDELETTEDPDRIDEIKAELEDLRQRRKEYQAIKRINSKMNPFLPEGYLESITNQYSGDYYNQEIEGRFIKFQGLIFKEFQQDRHVVPMSTLKDMTFERFFFGYDEGYRNPRVALKIGQLERDGTEDPTFVVVKEFYRTESKISDATPEIKGMGATDYNLYADPSAKSDIEEMKAEGIMAKSADNEVKGGIQRVKTLFDEDRLLVAEICQNTINELGTYQWKGDKDDPKDEPLKENDHAMDALRYALYSQQSQEIPMATL